MSRFAPIIVTAAVAFTSLSSILIRLSVAPPLVIAAWRMIIAAALIVPVTFVQSSRRRREEKVETVSKRTVLLLGMSGVFLAAHFATWVTSLSYTSVVHSTVLVTIHPLLVIIASIFVLRKPVPSLRIVLTVVALGGAIILASGGSVRGISPTLKGDILAFLGAVAVAGYLVIGSWARRAVSAGTYNAVVHTVAAISLVVLTAVVDQPLVPYPPREFVIFAALAVFCTILGHALLNWALRYVPAVDVSTAILLEPVFASIVAGFLFDEIPGVRTIFGAVIVLGAIAGMRYTRRVSS